MDFRHLIVTCLFSKLRLPFDNQKVKENYAILRINILLFFSRNFFLLTLLPHFHLLKTSKSYRNLLTHTQCSAQNPLIS